MAAKTTETKDNLSRIKVELRTPSKDQRTAFTGGIVDGKYKSYTIQLKEEVEIPTGLVSNLRKAYVMGMGEKGVLEPMPRYVVETL